MVHIDNDTEYSTSSTIHLTHFKYAHVKAILTIVCLGISFLAQCISVKHFKFLWLQLDKEVEQFLASTVGSTIDNTQNPGTKLQHYQYLQHGNRTCTKLNYTVLSQPESQLHVVIELHVKDGPCPNFYSHTLQIYVKL